MSARLRLLRCYPPTWRETYGDDLLAYLDDTYDGRMPLPAVASLLAAAMGERLRVAGLLGSATPAGEQLRGGLLAVLAGWAAFVVAGLSFAKLSEHFDSALSGHARHVPQVAFTVVQSVAVACALAVVLGVALALPALWRFLTDGGWPLLRRHVLAAIAASVLAVVGTVAISVWAHRLSAVQRNGGSLVYGAAWLGWVAIGVATITLWTAAAMTAARRLRLSRSVLLAEAGLAITVTVGMLVMLVATAIWWATVGAAAPAFLGAGAGSHGWQWNPQLVCTVVLMVLALATASAGSARIARARPALSDRTH